MKQDKLIIHCSATPPSLEIGVVEIREWHTGRGFLDIGYHIVIRRDGTREKGRPLMNKGAHAKGFNDYIGICLVGGVDDGGNAEANFTIEQYNELFGAVRELKDNGFIDECADVCGHRDLEGVNKECPCFNVRALFE